MSSLSGLPSKFQPVGSPTRANTLPAVSAGINARAGASRNQSLESWFEEYLKQQQQAAEEEDAEQAAFEAQKQAYKDNADFVYEGTDNFFVNSTVNPATGENVNWFFDVYGEYAGAWQSGNGDDVFYLEGNGFLFTGGGNDIVHLGDSLQDGYDVGDSLKQKAWLGFGDDKVYGSKGSQYADGNSGDDLIDLGDGFDIAEGGLGSDNFIIDLQNSGTDTILDFVDLGDKITVMNGGENAQDGEWYLYKANKYNGIQCQFIDESQQFYEIRNSDNVTAAVFGIGVRHKLNDQDLYSVKASMNSSGIEILESNMNYQASMEFV